MNNDVLSHMMYVAQNLKNFYINKTNTQMKKLYLLFIICFATLSIVFVNAQTIKYAYDMAGNRISRTITLAGQQGAKQGYQITDSVVVNETIGERKIKIYPNPTKGSLALEISGGDDKDQLRFILYNANGQQLLNKQIQSGTTPINMSDYPVAYYILRVQAGDKMTEFKIIKQ